MASPIQPLTGSQVAAITPDDIARFGAPFDALWIGGAGNVAIVADGDTAAVTIVGAAAGSIIPVRVKKVMSTNTTATSIVGIRY